MPNFSTAKCLGRSWVFPALFVLLIIINIPLFSNLVLPQHDTMYMFQTFYVFYNEFFFNNELPLWLPYGFHGVQSDYFLVTLLSPSAYFTGLLGWLLNVKNVLLLFNLSMFLEQLIYLFGTYLLAKKLFNHKATIFFVCATVICSTVLFYQFNQNFRIYNFLPLIIYLYMEFFLRLKITYLFAGMILLLVSVFGNSAYFTPVMVLPLAIILPALCIEGYRGRRLFARPSGREILISVLLLLLFLLTAGIYYYFISYAMEHVEGIYTVRDPITDRIYTGRDLITMATDLETFLTYPDGRFLGFKKFTSLLMPTSESIMTDITLHVGLIALFFTLYAFIFVRRLFFIAFGCVVAIFVLFSLGGKTPVAELLYHYFPTMKYYRHIGYVVSNLKLFLPFLAGFGVEHLLVSLEPFEREKATLSTRRINLTAHSAEIITAVAVMAGTFIYAGIVMQHEMVPSLVFTGIFLMLLYLLLRRLNPAKRFSIFLCASVAFHMISYQGVVNSIYSVRSNVFKPVPASSITVNRYGFQESKTIDPLVKRSKDTLPMIEKEEVKYTLAYGFLQWDPCMSTFRMDFLNVHVATLFKLKAMRLLHSSIGTSLVLPNDSNFIRSLGCGSPKLKLHSDVIFSDSLEESKDIIRQNQVVDKIIVLNRVSEETRSSWRGADARDGGKAGGSIEVKGFKANELALEVVIPEGRGAWLYYADAWHPAWKAFVNNKQVPIAQANIAFKAVRLDKGRSSVRFVFDNRRSRVLGNSIVSIGLISMLSVLTAMAFALYRAIMRR
jgi:hypothetical protein